MRILVQKKYFVQLYCESMPHSADRGVTALPLRSKDREASSLLRIVLIVVAVAELGEATFRKTEWDIVSIRSTLQGSQCSVHSYQTVSLNRLPHQI